MLYEMSRKVININKYEEVTLSWNNSVLIVRTSKDLRLLEFSYNLQSLQKEIDFKQSTLNSKNGSLSNDYLTRYVSRGVKNSELVEMVINSAFWPHNNQLMQELTNITVLQWSPFNLTNENYSLLAVINSVGTVEFFAPKKNQWSSIKNFSLEMKNHMGETWNMLFKRVKNFTEVKETIYNVTTSSMCWAPYLCEDNSCYFVTAQKSGVILFWSIKYYGGNVETQFCGRIQHCNSTELVCMMWLPIDEHKFVLITSNVDGEIVCNECQILDRQISLLQTKNVWSYKDKMVSTYLHYHFEGEKLLLFFNKHRHLVVQMYNKKFELLSQQVKNINDFKITSLNKHKDIFYMATINSKVYKIDYSVVDEILEVSLKLIEFKDTYSNYELYDLAISKNGAIFALALISRKLMYRKQSLKIEIVFLSQDIGFELDVSNILQNPSKTLIHMWDVIEVIRCKILKIRKLPDLDYANLLNDESDSYKLKVYLIFLTFWHNLKKTLTRGLKGTMPETSIDVVKEKILLLQAFTVIHNIYDLYQNNQYLNCLDREFFDGSKNYILYYCKKYNKNVTDLISDVILNISNLKMKYSCQGCDENLIEFTCKNKHVNMFCSRTFTPIEYEYLVCTNCNSTTRIELYQQNPTCVFCDLYLKDSNSLY